MHSDTKGRQSLALHVMEPVRPEVDDFVLGLLERRTCRKVEFAETSDGHVQLRCPLTHELGDGADPGKVARPDRRARRPRFR